MIGTDFVIRIFCFLFLFLFCFRLSAQDRFEGVIEYRHIGFDQKKDTVFGDPYRVLFGKNAVKIELISKEGIIVQERLILIDSLKEIFVDMSEKTYSEMWKGKATTIVHTYSPWGLNYSMYTNDKKIIVGYKTVGVRLSNKKGFSNYGYIYLDKSPDLSYHLPPQINKNIFMGGLLFFDGNIVLGSRFVTSTTSHFQDIYVATKIEAKEIDASEFTIPPGFNFKKIVKTEFEIK